MLKKNKIFIKNTLTASTICRRKLKRIVSTRTKTHNHTPQAKRARRKSSKRGLPKKAQKRQVYAGTVRFRAFVSIFIWGST